MFFWVGMTHGCTGAFTRKKGGIEFLAGPAPSSQTVGSLLRTPWLAKLTIKIVKYYINDYKFGNFFIPKMMFANFTIW
jgi:hypothetical protein